MKLLLVLIFVGLAVAKNTFFGDQVLTLHPDTQEHVKLIQGLDETIGLVDFWSPQYSSMVKMHSSVDIRIHRADVLGLKKLFQQNELRFDVKIEDVQTLIHEQVAGRQSESPKAFADYDYNIYHTYDEIVQWTEDVANAHTDIVTRSTLGYSFEGREIPELIISKNDANPMILVDCGIHAREWISPAFCQCFVRNLLSDPDLLTMLDSLTFIILPVVNVDGYVYTWINDDTRMWRKTRSVNKGFPNCIGTDPNRNFNAGWGGGGSSSIPCAETYMGSSVESEVEVKALSDLVRSLKDQIKVYVTFHSYSQMILYPYSYTYDLAATNNLLAHYAEQANIAIEAAYGTAYINGPGAETIYLAAGGSDDFSYDTGVNLAYTVELRDTGRYGFLLPARFIEPTCIETTDLMKVFSQAAIDLKDA